MASPYQDAYAASLRDPEAFWAAAAGDIVWYKRWDKVLDDTRKPFYRWFRGGQLNTCHNALDVHVAGGRADQTALIYDSPITGTLETYSYRALLEEVAQAAGALAAHGVAKGDRVIL
ncbi:MAG: acetyl-coenzyme A synthetase N-terminal domain-containing protein, partial [Rhodospirillaceae bacterium]